MPQLENIDDVVASTLGDLGPASFQQIAQDLVRYPGMRTMLKKGTVKFGSGYRIERRVMIDQSKTAKHVPMAYAEDTLAVQDNLKKIHVPWRHTTNNFMYDLSEIRMNSEPARIVNLLQERRVDMLLGMAEKLELALWGKPDGSTDEETPYGVQYWLASDSSDGFNGGNITGFSDGPGNLSAATYSNWSNYTATYASFTEESFSKKLRKAFRAIGFQSPVNAPSLDRKNLQQRYKICCGEDVIEGTIAVARQQNDNIGSDLAKFDEGVMFKRLPFMYVPAIDSTFSNNDVFMLDMANYYVVVQKGDNFRETGPDKVPNRHNVRAVYTDFSWNVFCTDRRRQAWIYQA